MSISKNALGLIAAIALVISGCSSTESDTDVTPGDAHGSAEDKSEAGGPAPDPTGDDEDSEPADAGTTAEDIVATVEAMGFECEDQDRRLTCASLQASF